MNAPLRKAGVVILVLFGLLFANLNWVQAYKGDEYRTTDRNGRVRVAEYEIPRGVIEAGGQALAESKATDGELKFLRVYPEKQVYAPIVGYKPVGGAEVGIERSEDEFLSGASDKLFADRISAMFTGEEPAGGNVVLSIKPKAQEVAWKQLTNNERGAKKGSAVAIDPRTGAIQALVTMPSYDPNPLASHDDKVSGAAYKKLNEDKDKPLLNRATSENYPPGSTMKVIIAAAALKNGYTQSSEIQAGPEYIAPGSGAPIRNAEAETCPSSKVTLKEALTDSCNTGFARLGVELGGDKVKKEAQAWGFEQEDLTIGSLRDGGLPVTASRTGAMQNADGSIDQAALAQSSIGQREVRMTTVQGALMAATVANGGRQMRPYLVQQELSPDRRPIYNADPTTLRTPIDSKVAGDLKEMMVSVVENGTGKRAQIDGYEVGGKTGTAQNAEGADPHGWFVGFAFNDKGQPVSAVCVMLENVSGGHASAEAARIAGKIMKAAAGGGGD
ncbi:penicillin-binding protein A [Actinoplanes sp. NBRC 14428]|uniref:Peptidoglycan glycosyltransferase n=1 Tax=Pseudosporangium ferrugineum TaxID=439699 RepID=A0A2T0S139_9ACTN|nr:penicillin-binding protein 2 [Pseudosporangium ferrugineum]PRY27139.1 peptidoglycan glycosyltransferase [Pseudosporangium ferrugineum]BCJ53187.1 penicillin-binding protein A [Actinoplanes sp. NBRC 14428]